METTYARYLELTTQIASLEQERKILGAGILKHLEAEGAERVTTGTGVISLKSRTSWKYTPAVKSKIDLIQKKAQESGDAEQVTSTYLSTSLR